MVIADLVQQRFRGDSDRGVSGGINDAGDRYGA